MGVELTRANENLRKAANEFTTRQTNVPGQQNGNRSPVTITRNEASRHKNNHQGNLTFTKAKPCDSNPTRI